ncbi:sugar ABC transporter permease [Pseudonocardia sp. KRD-184]|uniref:Sugar ABC transporter permease n=1 Tax=Pseudonocardia oceani TaxID=2792013 RepID=A0ABS6UIK2_9PSEU|nr:sugar ABC transporter permease [Pseudonocardia oceani]MBW0091512.1 sugar ABC transporter permease [Pseudonocardia oceani]MBW0097022.1 sugar ABC transporter permease [Pseudonocardia oceani]MBW0111175.1 sugar ABC transporter permease [Pseudonocardia oceani]MBW0122670.1 sugar ABC transporter permease [Pseudonocardia oceani]MBW0132081.1 sugar ABC transporter permease [Pseudonocardia oceani]
MTVTAAPPVAPPEARRRRPRASGARPSRALWLFAAPALLLHTYFLAAPALQTLLYSVTDWDGYSADFAWVGVDNYTGLLTADDQFRNAAVNSLQFTLVVTIAQTLISLALAVLLTRTTRASTLLRAVFFFPAILSSVAVAFVWKFVYDPGLGPLEPALAAVGLGGSGYLSEPGTAILWLALVQVWAHAGQLMVVFIAGLQQIPEMYYEAAKVDGASRAQRFRHITLPLVAPTALIVVAYTTVQSFKAFDLVLGLAGNPPNPPLDILATRIYAGFADSRFGYAAAESVLFLVLIALVTWLQRRAISRGTDA